MSFTVEYDPELENRLVRLPSGGTVSLNDLAEALPHGSGINCKWRVDVLKNGNVNFHNDYHAMNEDGYYDGYYPFTVRLFLHKKDVRNPLRGPLAGKVQVVHRKGDWDFRVTGIRSRKYHDVLEWITESVFEAWSRWEIGKFRQEQENADETAGGGIR